VLGSRMRPKGEKVGGRGGNLVKNTFAALKGGMGVEKSVWGETSFPNSILSRGEKKGPKSSHNSTLGGIKCISGEVLHPRTGGQSLWVLEEKQPKGNMAPFGFDTTQKKAGHVGGGWGGEDNSGGKGGGGGRGSRSLFPTFTRTRREI